MQNVFSVDVVVQTVCLHMGDGNRKKWILGASKWFHFPIEPTFKWDRTDAIWLFCMFSPYVTVVDIDWNDDDDTLVSTVSSVSSVGCGMWSSEDVGTSAQHPAAASCVCMMGSWRYIPAAADQTEVSWRPKCPLCGHKSRPTSQIVKSSHKFHIRNFPLSRNKSTGFLGSKHQRLERAADVSQLWSSSSLVALRLNRSKVTEDSGNASDIYDETYNRYEGVIIEN